MNIPAIPKKTTATSNKPSREKLKIGFGLWSRARSAQKMDEFLRRSLPTPRNQHRYRMLPLGTNNRVGFE